MDNLGVDSPEDELKLIQLERANPQLFPGDVQAYVAVMNMLQQMQQQKAQMDQAAQQLQAPQEAALAGGPGGALAAGAAAAQNQEFGMQPSLTEDMNQAGPAQPMTQEGGPAPAGSNPTSTTLIRNTPTGQATTLQQTVIRR